MYAPGRRARLPPATRQNCGRCCAKSNSEMRGVPTTSLTASRRYGIDSALSGRRYWNRPGVINLICSTSCPYPSPRPGVAGKWWRRPRLQRLVEGVSRRVSVQPDIQDPRAPMCRIVPRGQPAGRLPKRFQRGAAPGDNLPLSRVHCERCLELLARSIFGPGNWREHLVPRPKSQPAAPIPVDNAVTNPALPWRHNRF